MDLERADVKLKLTHGGNDDFRPRGILSLQNLDRAFLAELPEPQIELLASQRIGQSDASEVLRGEAGENH